MRHKFQVTSSSSQLCIEEGVDIRRLYTFLGRNDVIDI